MTKPRGKAQRTGLEFFLKGQVCVFEDSFFLDMTFRQRDLERLYCRFEERDESGSFKTIVDSIIQDYLSIIDYEVRVMKLPTDILGDFRASKYRIRISESIADDRAAMEQTLLHEMTHAYVHQLKCLGLDYAVYEHIQERLEKRLGARRLRHVKGLLGHHTIAGSAERNERAHCLLFWLKTIDLDLRLQLPLGTIAGYGKSELLDTIGRSAR